MKEFVSVTLVIAAILACAYAVDEKRTCKLSPHPSVEYSCLLKNDSAGTRPCQESVPDGTVVRPSCRTPNYFYPGVLPFMRCIGGRWDYVATCVPDCGIAPPTSELLPHRRSVNQVQVPWHGAVYRKISKPYMLLCGATLVSPKVVLSGAHCFWDNSKNSPYPAAEFAVAVGKTHRSWDSAEDQSAQKSDVAEIKLPSRFRGMLTNYQEDIAVLLLATEVNFTPTVRPVCLDFDITFERRQLKENALGQIAAWGLDGPNGRPVKFLKVVQMPYVPIEKCITASPPSFLEYITADKICAGSLNGIGLCRGDSGGGFTFPETERGVQRHYLRGIVSTAPTSESLCNEKTYNTFTQISRHEHFIKEFL